MHKVVWTDKNGQSHALECDRADARDLFRIVVTSAIRGNATDVLLVAPDGNYVDTWGT